VRVKYITSVIEADDQTFAFGSIRDVDAELGQRLIAAGQAIPAEPETSTAAVAPGERAVRRRGRPRKTARA